jgi:hypothetical protein
MRITASGNVGIGTTSPGAKIHVVGSESRFGGVASGYISVYNATGRSGYIQANGGTDLRIASDSDPMTMYVNGSERMRISSAGALKLNAYGSGSNTGTATQRLAVDASGNVIEIPIGSGPVDGNGTANFVTKWSDADTITNSQIFDNGTSVGVGTTSPTEFFHIRSTGFATPLYIEHTAATSAYLGIANSGGRAYIYSSSNDLVFGTTASVTERMRITSAGNVGIGTTSPASILHVEGGSPTTNLIASSGNGFLRIADSATSATRKEFTILLDNTNNRVDIQAIQQGVAARNITLNASGGNVGIGTTSPLNPLFVSASNAADYAAFIENTNSSNGYGLVARTAHTGTSAYAFAARAAATDIFVVRADGNVGIGTTSPSVKLHTVGDGLFFSNTNTNLTINSNGGAASLTLTNTAGNQVIYGGVGGSNNMDFYTGSAFRMRIDASGNVGIGTTSPSYKLDVRGNLLAVGPNGGPGIIGIWEAESIASTGGSIVSDSSASGGSAWTTNGNYQLFGPYTNLPRGNYRLSVRVKVADASYTGNAVRINVYIPSVGSAQDRYIKGIDFSANDTWEMFSIPFNITAITANNVEFYVFGLNSQNISVDYLSVTVDNDSYTAQNWGNLYVNGNVGIGTTSPAAKLHTAGSGIVNIVQSSDTVSYTQYYNTSTGNGSTSDGLTVGLNGIDAYVFSREAGNLILGTLDTERVRITSAGNVGIGTSAPSSGLVVATYGSKWDSDSQYNQPAGNIFSNLAICVADQENWIGLRGAYGSSTGSANLLLQANFRDVGSNAGHYVASQAISLGNADFVIGRIQTQTSVSTAPAKVEQLRIFQSGKLKLNLYGSGTFTGTPTYNLGVDASGNVIELPGGVVDGSGTANYVTKWSDANTVTNSQIRDDGTTVGIGTAPAAAKLTVNGPVNVGGRYLYNNSQAALDTTGVNVAGLSASTNGDSAFFTFEAGAGDGQYQRIVYSCYNAGGTWNVVKVIDEGTNRFDVVASASSGSTITFTWKSRSGIIYYTPRLIITGVGSIDTTYL